MLTIDPQADTFGRREWIDSRFFPEKTMFDLDVAHPKTLAEAARILSSSGPVARLYAGGTDLLVRIRSGLDHPSLLVDLKQIPELQAICSIPEDEVTIGAAAPLAGLLGNRLLQQKFPVLLDACKTIGGIQIRNAATPGGNLANASPAADLAPPLLVLGAKVRTFGPNGEREIYLKDFFLGPGKTAMQQEIITAILIPLPKSPFGASFVKLGNRKAMTLSVVCAAASVQFRGEAQCQSVRLSLGAVAPIPLLFEEAGEALEGNEWKEIVDRLLQKALGRIQPIDDVRSSAAYRREMVRVLVPRVLDAAASLARKKRGTG